MKKHISLFLLTTLCLSTTLVYFGCKKSNSAAEEADLSAFNSRPKKGTISFPINSATSRIMGTVDISADGYLIFPDADVLESYRQFIIGHTHAQVQTYINSEGFVSHGTSLYTRGFMSQTVTDLQAADYLLNSDKLVQIGRVIYRPKSTGSCGPIKWDFVLAMEISNLNPTSLASIKTGTYDGAYMNQFATNPETEPEYTIDEYMRTTPTGHQETTPSSCVPPGGENLRRPMFGHGGWSNTTCTLDDPNNWTDHNGDGDTDPTYIQCRRRREYVFWIGTGWDTDCYVAYGCS